MSLPHAVAESLQQHVTFELFPREHHGVGAVSSRKMKAISEQFIGCVQDYSRLHGVEAPTFEKASAKKPRGRNIFLASRSEKECCSSASPSTSFAPTDSDPRNLTQRRQMLPYEGV